MKVDPEVVQLVQALNQATEKLNWTATPDSGVYRLILDAGIIRIGRGAAGNTIAGALLGTPPYTITILDPSGTQVFGEENSYSREEFGALAGLYDTVDGRIRGAVVRNLVDELRRKMAETYTGGSASGGRAWREGVASVGGEKKG